MPLSSAQTSAIAHRKQREQAARDFDIEQNRLSVAVGATDEQPLYPAYLGRDLRIYCTKPACVGRSGFAPPVFRASEPETLCAHCGDPIGPV